MGFRDYNPGLNRFLTRDNYNGALSDMNLGADAFTGNRYAFTGGNPITNVELDGHEPCVSGNCNYLYTGDTSFLSAEEQEAVAQQAQATWDENHTPSSSDHDHNVRQFAAGSALTIGEAYWERLGSVDTDEVACFGRLGCDKALEYLLDNKDDVAGAKKIAANYCVDHLDECQADAASYEDYSTVAETVVTVLSWGRPGGGTAKSSQPAVRYGPGAQRAGEPKWPTPTASNCSECAVTIQRIMGGGIKTIKSPGPVLGPSKHNPAGNWSYHDVVVSNGRVYDGFTGPRGLTIAEFKAQFEYGDVINFGF